MTGSTPYSKLGRVLADNHKQLSTLSDRVPNDMPTLLGWDEPGAPSRVVVVVGAGASHATNGMPTGDLAARELLVRLRIDADLYDQERRRLSTVYRINRDDFETQLLAMSKFAKETLLDELRLMFWHRHAPSFLYELLAHLLKHRFVDAIINFNFDELLDQAIDDELGVDNYHRIVSDGDCSDDILLMDDCFRFRRPLYIKPHGTASHKSSMRFTRAAYFELPGELRRVLERLFQDLPTHVLVVGHAMQSFEFNQIVGGAIDGSALYYFNIDEPRFDTSDSEHLNRFVENGEKFKVTKHETLEHHFQTIWRAISEQHWGGLGPRDIVRHRLIGDVFNRPVECSIRQDATDARRKTIGYLKDRTMVELALSVAKSKGFVNLKQLTRSRAGRYFRLWKEKGGNTTHSLYDLCCSLGLVRSSYSREVLVLNEGRVEERGDPHLLIVKREIFHEKCVERLIKETENQCGAFKEDLKKNEKTFRETLIWMYDGDEVEVAPADPGRHWEIFEAPTALSTLTSLKLYTRDLLRSEWDTLLCIAETGEWLLKDEIAKQVCERQVAVIVADKAYEEALNDKFKDHIKVKAIPWWLHNQHMTLFMHNQRPVSGIVFSRRLRAASIEPLLLRAEDCGAVLDTFMAYWLKVERTKESVIGRDEVEENWSEFWNQLRQGTVDKPTALAPPAQLDRRSGKERRSGEGRLIPVSGGQEGRPQE